MKMYELREERAIKPETFAHMVSGMLYQKRFGPWFVEPVVAGLKDDKTPFVCAMDLIGCVPHRAPSSRDAAWQAS